MLSFVPVTLDLYRTVRRHLHWTLQNLVAFADRTGRRFPSVRTLAAATGQPRSTLSRHLAQLAAELPPNWWTPLLSSEGSGKVSNGPGTASFYG